MTYQFIEINRLVKSPLNVRRTVAKGAAEDLKASILAHGLMHNLVVTDAGDGTYHVIDGARRLEALKALKAEGKLDADYAAPCQLRVGEADAVESSLAANTVRLAMHPADEYEAFATLAADGASPEQIGLRFGKPVKHVEQRLKLGNLDPKLLKEYRAEILTLDCLMAFAITDDRKRQLKVYRALKDSRSLTPRAIRAALTEMMAEADSKLAKFVGLDAYRAAGGTTRSDLFSETVYLENPELLNDLAIAKLADVRLELETEGWGWIEVSQEREWDVVSACGHIHPRPAEVPQELAERRRALEAELLDIREALDDAESDQLLDREEAAEAGLAEIDQQIESLAIYDPEQVRIAGCYVSIRHDGSLLIEKGLVRRQDTKRLTQDDEPQGKRPRGMPMTLKRDLEAYRLQIAQVEVAKHPAIAFDLLVFSAVCGVFDHIRPHDGVDVLFRESYPKPSVEGDTAAARRLEAMQLSLEWLKQDGEAARFQEFRTLSQEEKLAMLAYCTVLTLKPKLAPAGDDRITAYDIALAQTGADAASYWRPTKANYLSRITRDQLLSIGREILGDPWAQSRSKDKKGELAEQLDRAFAEPEKSGRTPEQIEKLKRWLPEGLGLSASFAPEPKAKSKKARKAA